MKNVKSLPKVRDGRQRRATKRGARHAKNPPGTKVGRAVLKSPGQEFHLSRPVFHGGELTAAAKERSARLEAGREVEMIKWYEKTIGLRARELTAAHGKKLVNYKDRDEKRVVITKGEKWSVTRG